MLADDDVIVDLAKLLEAIDAGLPTSRFYAGQVWASHFNQPKLPQRDPSHRNYLPLETYPMSQLPPFAIGPHYLMSMDCAAFIDVNLEGHTRVLQLYFNFTVWRSNVSGKASMFRDIEER